jgi:hypothetical protein
MSSSFTGNNPSLQIHSSRFSEDRGKCYKTGNPSISDFSTILTSDIMMIPILAASDSSHLPSDEAYRQCLSLRLRLPCNRLSTPSSCQCYECKPNTRHFFDKSFIKALIPRLPGGNVSIMSHDICRLTPIPLLIQVQVVSSTEPESGTPAGR